jgi:hypothetical protein
MGFSYTQPFSLIFLHILRSSNSSDYYLSKSTNFQHLILEKPK